MTRKDYIKLADALWEARLRCGGPSTDWWHCVEEICDALAADNARFNRELFVERANRAQK